ncbi:HAD family hydrolase, partial [Akkermansia muciniphila]
WGMSPDEAVYVGDAVSDIKACREVRVKVIAAAWAPSADVEALRRAEPDFLLTDMSELLPLISEI